MKPLFWCALLLMGTACELKSTEFSSSVLTCVGDGGLCADARPLDDARAPWDAGHPWDAGQPWDAPSADAGSGSGTTQQGTFPDPNGPPPPLETTCDCIDADADAICDTIDPCIGSCGGPTPPPVIPDPLPPGPVPVPGAAMMRSVASTGLASGDFSTLELPPISAWGCEYNKPTCTAGNQTACVAIKDCEWVSGACRQKACVNSWRDLCLSFIGRRAATDKYAYRGNSTWESDLFTTGPNPVPVEWRWGEVVGSVNYSWEGHSGMSWANNFLTFVTQVVRDRVPTATNYNILNNGCSTFALANFQTIKNYMRNTLHPILRAATPRQKAVLCGHQITCSTNDSTAYRACGDGQCAGARGNDFSRLCFSIDGADAAAVITYNIFNQCRIGSSCTNAPGNNLSWCRSSTGTWACQKCTQVGTTATWTLRSEAIASCNTVAGVPN